MIFRCFLGSVFEAGVGSMFYRCVIDFGMDFGSNFDVFGILGATCCMKADFTKVYIS